MLPGECVGFDGATCECGKKLDLRVLQSAAGFYLGYFCDDCGPFSRETVYMTLEEAERQLRLVKLTGGTIYERI